MIEYHTKIGDIEPRELGREVANTQYRYQRNLVKLLVDKFRDSKQIIPKDSPLPKDYWDEFIQPTERTANGLYLVKRNLTAAWNCCKDHEGNEKHPVNWNGLSVEDLANDVGDTIYGYNYLGNFCYGAAHTWLEQARGDKEKGYVQLPPHILDAALNTVMVALNLKQLQMIFERKVPFFAKN